MSAYALIVEEGTALARRIKRGELPMPDDDDLADKYLLADERLAAAGLEWYEVSNWARDRGSRCRHNMLLLDRRRLVGGRSGRALPRRRRALVERQAPRGVRRAAGRRARARRRRGRCWTPRPGGSSGCCWRSGCAEGLPGDLLDAAGAAAVHGLVARGLVDGGAADAGWVVLTRSGRLLADAVVRDLLPG